MREIRIENKSSTIEGLGVFTKEAIKEGELIKVRRNKRVLGYQYFNHRCQHPNLIVEPINGERWVSYNCFRALRDIETGEELTFNYQTLTLKDHYTAVMEKGCKCPDCITLAEGYQEIAEENKRFAEEVFPLACEVMQGQEKKKEPITISDVVEALSGVPELKEKELEFPMQQEINSFNLASHVRQILEIVGHPEAWVTDETTIEHFLPAMTNDDVEENRELLEKLSRNLGFQVQEEDFLVDVAKRLKAKKEENQQE